MKTSVRKTAQQASVAVAIGLVGIGLILGTAGVPLIVLGFLVGVIGGRYGDVGR